jgi:hypothetical protein
VLLKIKNQFKYRTRHSDIFVVKQKFDFVRWAIAKKKLFDESASWRMRSSFSGLKIKLQLLSKIAVSLDLSFVTFLCVKVKKSKENNLCIFYYVA